MKLKLYKKLHEYFKFVSNDILLKSSSFLKAEMKDLSSDSIYHLKELF